MSHVFCDEFRSRLKLGKYTSWAEDLPEESLEALLWMVGEFGIRAGEYQIMKRIDFQWWLERLAPLWPGLSVDRMAIALVTIAEITRGARIDRNTVFDKINTAKAKFESQGNKAVRSSDNNPC